LKIPRDKAPSSCAPLTIYHPYSGYYQGPSSEKKEREALPRQEVCYDRAGNRLKKLKRDNLRGRHY
jgi:hypothetical protein